MESNEKLRQQSSGSWTQPPGIVTATEGFESSSRDSWRGKTAFRSFGGASTLCRCLSLRTGFLFICLFGLCWGIFLLSISVPLLRAFKASDSLLNLLSSVLSSSQWEMLVAKLDYRGISKPGGGVAMKAVTSVDKLASGLQRWCWWGVWLVGLLWFLASLLGFWGMVGWCLGKDEERRMTRRHGLLLISSSLLGMQWVVSLAFFIGLPIWVRVAFHISLFSPIGGVFYTIAVLGCPLFVGFWITDAAFSFYFVRRVGGSGNEKKSAAVVQAEKAAAADDSSIDELESSPLLASEIV